ncbi:MFS transporter [Yinghuangia seranimata]|uniref:MFS transporter n=1 Tax=Yinghuangia seranimata TaxID=408067 RepID=UPI00248C9734|nr:MFS transporter [Yinghuangia seranimata]MDI2124541.1 MFS transporter [Yinghuangia seranimata]
MTPLAGPPAAPATTARRVERPLMAAAFVTALGNNVQLIAGALLLVRGERTMMAVGWLFVAVAAPQALLSPLFGRVADRYDRRTLWIACDAASAAVALALPFWLAYGGRQDAGIYATTFALSVVSALHFPVSNSLVKERVAADALRRFSGTYEMAMQAGMLLSATVGGLALQWLGITPLLVFNAATFVVSALFVAVLPRRRERPRVEEHAEEGAGGRRASGPMVLGMILLYAQGSVLVTVFNALLPKFVIGELGYGSAVFGVVDAVGSLAFVAAAVLYRVLARRTSDLRIAVVGFLACDVALAVQGQFGIAVLVVGVGVGALVFGPARIATRSMLLASVDEAGAGRAFGLANGFGLAATIAVMMGVAQLTDHTSARYGFAAVAAIGALTTAAPALLLMRLRARERAAGSATGAGAGTRLAPATTDGRAATCPNEPAEPAAAG